MTGLADIVSSQIRGLRLSEIRASRRYRVLNIFVFISCKIWEHSRRWFGLT